MNGKRMLSLLLLTVILVNLLGGCAAPQTAVQLETISAAEKPSAAVTEAQPEEKGTSILGDGIDVAGKLVILHTNDVHGRAVQAEKILGYTAVAALKEKVEAEGAEVLLLDAGDASQGMAIVNMSQGMQAMDFMNAVGYDAMALGNHEFDWSCDNVWQLIDRAQFPVMGANIMDRSTGECSLEKYVIFTLRDGRKIGVFGIDTPETATKAHPDKVRDIQVLMGQELYDCAQAQVDALKAENCDLVIMLCHLGVDEASAPNRSIDVLENTTGIDLCIDGHSHTVMEGGEVHNNALLTSTGAYLANIGWVVVETDGSMKAGLYHATDALLSEEKVSALVQAADEEVRELLSKVIGRTDVLLDGAREHVRTGETNLGDLVDDAILWQAEQFTGRKIDAAITNGGSIRDSVPVGEITSQTIITVFPFSNTVVVLDVTGAELLEALEASCYALPDMVAGFPQVSGMEIEVDTSAPYETEELYPDTTYGKPSNPGSRVTIKSIGGKEFDPEAIYSIATNDFLAAGGDTYYALKYAGQTAKTDTGVLLEDAIVGYIEQVLGGEIGQQYAAPAGRVTVK